MRRLIAPFTIALGFVGVLLAGLVTATHAAQGVAPDDGSLLDLARPIFDQIMAGDYIPAAAFTLVFCVALFKRYAPDKFGLRAFVHSDPGGVLTTFLMSFGGALATATIGDAPWTWEMLLMSAKVSFFAIGGYVGVKKFLLPLLQPLMSKAPKWMQPVFTILFWAFDRKSEAAKIEADAAKAGQDAVVANPPTGVDGVLGSPTEIK